MKARRIAAMTRPEVLPGGNNVTFVITDPEGGATKYQVPVNALDMIIANLETLASKAIVERGDRQKQPFAPDPSIPPTVVHPDYFQVEDLGANDLQLVMRRRGRSEIRASLSRESLQNFITAMSSDPEKPTKN